MVVSDDAGRTTDSLKRTALYRESVRLFRAAYSIFPDYKMMYNNWGFAYYSLGDLDSAEWAWGRQRKLYPESRFNDYNKELLDKAKYERCLQLYNARYKDGGNYPFLKKVLLEALSYRPKESAGWTILGKVYYLNRQADSARICWSRAAELDSSNAEAKSLMDIR
jgi:Flp pilus assembly protein TadD